MNNIFSAFDGIGTAAYCFNKAGIPIKNYYASEIDKKSMIVSKFHNPNIINLGDITKINKNMVEPIDYFVGGSPCQGFSVAGKKLNLDDPRSKLFFDFVRLKNELSPKFFLLENVVISNNKTLDIINEMMGVEPYLINSVDFSCQHRQRLYWTNIKVRPYDKNPNIIGANEMSGGWYPARMIGRKINERGVRDDYNKNIKPQQYIECRLTDTTSCLTTVGKDCIFVKEFFTGRKYHKDVEYRYPTQSEMEQMQTLPIGYTSLLSRNQSLKALGNGWTAEVIIHILKSSLIP